MDKHIDIFELISSISGKISEGEFIELNNRTKIILDDLNRLVHHNKYIEKNEKLTTAYNELLVKNYELEEELNILKQKYDENFDKRTEHLEQHTNNLIALSEYIDKEINECKKLDEMEM